MQTDPVDDAVRGSASARELVAQVLSEAKELVRLEVRLARAELKDEIRRAKRAAVAGAIGAVFVILTLAILLVAVVLALGGTAIAALVVAAALAVLGATSLGLAYASMPKQVLEHTREQMKEDVEHLKEHVA